MSRTLFPLLLASASLATDPPPSRGGGFHDGPMEDGEFEDSMEDGFEEDADVAIEDVVRSIDNLDPTKVTNQASMRDFMGHLKKTVRDLAGDNVALRSKSDELTQNLQEAVERASAKPAATRDISGPESHLARRYVNEKSGEVRLKTSRTRFEYAGRSYDAELPGIFDDREVFGSWHEDVQKLLTQRSLARMCQKYPSTPVLDMEVARALSRAPASIAEALEKTLEARASRAFNNTSGAGGEWMPETFIPDLYEEFETPSNIAALFESVPMTGDTIRRPKLTTGVRPYLKSRITSDDPAKYTPSTPVTADDTTVIQGFAVRILVDEADSEDSAIAAVPTLQRLAVKALNDGYEDCLLEPALPLGRLRPGRRGRPPQGVHRPARAGLRSLHDPRPGLRAVRRRHGHPRGPDGRARRR